MKYRAIIMRKLVTKTIPAKDIKLELTMCDICETEIPVDELPIEFNARNKASTSRMFVGVLFNLFGINKEKPLDDNPLIGVEGFDVHFECAVKAIANAVNDGKTTDKVRKEII